MIELLGVTENQPRRDADALLQRSHMQFLGVDPSRQAHPQNETAGRPGHLRAFGEILLHRQLESAEVLAVLLADVTQMAVVTTVFQIGGNAHLRDAAG
ncbi:hypothetical protein D3C81_734670 [compost metagenome]